MNIEKTEEKVEEENKNKKEFEVSSLETGDSSFRGGVFFVIFLLLGLLVGLVFWMSPRAVLTLKPNVSLVPMTQNFLIVVADSEVPPEEENLPRVRGIYVENEVSETQTFPTTGRKYDLTNAYGTITLFNETERPKKLVPSRLMTENGVVFRFFKPVVIPARDGDNAGTAIVTVRADEYDEDGKPVGQRGNILAGTELFFPALRDDLQELYYGRADRGPLVGGSTLTHYYMADDDISHTREFLEDTFRTRALEKLRSEIERRSVREKKQFILIDNKEILKSKILEEKFPEELIGKPVETFDVFAHLSLQGIVFDQSEVVEFLTEKALEIQDVRKKLLYLDEKSAYYSVLVFSDPENENENWIKVSIEIKGVEMFDFYKDSLASEEWRQLLKKEIAGKSRREVLGILTNYPEIEDIIDIKISPFWSEKIPSLWDQIDFEVEDDYK